MTKKWLQNSSEEVIKKIDNFPGGFEQFKLELMERDDIIGDLQVIELNDIEYSEHFAVANFKVKSLLTGEIYNQEYISRRGGKYHSLRGVVLVKVKGEIKYFIVRKCNRFGIGEEVYESLGNIYQIADEFRKNKFELSKYIEDQVKTILHLNKIKADRFFDLGNVYTDVSMFNNVVRIFALTIEVEEVGEITLFNEGKKFNDKGYTYSVEVMPIEKFYEFFGGISDSFLLSIFGRLQALDIVKL